MTVLYAGTVYGVHVYQQWGCLQGVTKHLQFYWLLMHIRLQCTNKPRLIHITNRPMEVRMTQRYKWHRCAHIYAVYTMIAQP